MLIISFVENKLVKFDDIRDQNRGSRLAENTNKLLTSKTKLKCDEMIFSLMAEYDV